MHKYHTESLARSLLWSFGSPPLVHAASDSRWQDDEWFSWRALELAGVFDHPGRAADLTTFVSAEKDRRLGARFERLIEYGLSHLPGFDCVHRRLQVHADGHTQGEFDFIVRDRNDDRLEHWEVACKFYLGVPFEGSLGWVGPGKRDSLIRKLRHLTDRQLGLGELPAYREGVGAEAPIARTRAILKGRLFYPLSDGALSSVAPFDSEFEFLHSRGKLMLNSRAPSGFWCDFNQLKKLELNKMVSLHKPQWLDPGTGERTVDFGQLESDLLSGPQCIDVETADGHRRRGFIVQPGWFDDLEPAVAR